MARRSRVAGFTGLFFILTGCGSSTSGDTTTPASDDASFVDGDDGAVVDPDAAASEGGETGCSTDAECTSALSGLTPTPAGCAEAFCDKASGHCGLRAVDKDGDGYRTAKCDVPGVASFLGGD